MENIVFDDISKTFLYSHMRVEHPKVDFHLHNGYEIFFLISGDVKYFVEKKIYPLAYGELMITNNHEIHKPAFSSNKIYERICLEFDPAVVNPFNSNNFNLSSCFSDRKDGEMNKITLTPPQTDLMLDLFKSMEQTCSDTAGNEVLRLTYLVQLLVLINRLIMKIPVEMDYLNNIPERLVPVLNYIDSSHDADLSLETLEKKFFINRYYLSKLFKKSIGSNIHNYILFKRISKAKILLSYGASVTDACLKSGFTDYSNFLKQFKKTVGMSPGKYKAKNTPTSAP